MSRFGDRKDGKRVRDINGINHIMYHLGKSRCSNEVYIDYPIDVTNLVKYVDNLSGDVVNDVIPSIARSINFI